VGVEQEFTPARKAHPGFRADGLDVLAERIGAVTWADPAEIPGGRRFHCADPFGHRLEFLE
jgi:predicted enzyme related to lactoylglutathione lyase